MSDTFFTASPHWTWFIIPYFFVGGLAGGAYFLPATLEWFGRPEDRPVIRTAYSLAFWGAILSGALLALAVGRPLRFWHMLVQYDDVPHLMFKGFSPISFGAWAILLFGACAFVSWRRNAPGTLTKLVAAVGGLLGFFVAGYTGVLLTVTNRPIWAESPSLGAPFLASGASTAAAALTLLAPRRMAPRAVIGMFVLTAVVSPCPSPAAARTRGGGPAADPGNHGAVVQLHAGAKIYHKTPCRTVKVKCSGPLPDAGT